MLKFLIDEDMPRSTAEIFRFAQEEEAIILTGDMGFGNLLRFPPGEHRGIIIAHFPNEIPTVELNRQIIMAFDKLSEADFQNNLIILEPCLLYTSPSPRD